MGALLAAKLGVQKPAIHGRRIHGRIRGIRDPSVCVYLEADWLWAPATIPTHGIDPRYRIIFAL